LHRRHPRRARRRRALPDPRCRRRGRPSHVGAGRRGPGRGPHRGRRPRRRGRAPAARVGLGRRVRAPPRRVQHGPPGTGGRGAPHRRARPPRGPIPDRPARPLSFGRVTLVAPRKDAPAPTRDDRPSSGSGRGFEVPAFLRDLSWRFWVFTPALAVLVLAVPVLTWKGFSILRHEETGQRRDVVTDPAAEAYEALVTSTPTALQLDLDGAGALAGVTLLTRPSQQGGGNIVFLPWGTVMQVPLPGDAGVLERTLAQIYTRS